VNGAGGRLSSPCTPFLLAISAPLHTEKYVSVCAIDGGVTILLQPTCGQKMRGFSLYETRRGATLWREQGAQKKVGGK